MSSNLVVIIGGGAAGLVAAYDLQERGQEWLLLESSDVLGGRVRSEKLSGISVDFGTHLVAEADQLVALAGRLGVECETQIVDVPVLKWNGTRFLQIKSEELSPWEQMYARSKFTVFRPGIHELITKISQALPKDRVKLGTSVVKLLTDEQGKLKAVQLGDGRELSCGKAIVALPGLDALGILPRMSRPLAVGLREVIAPPAIHWDFEVARLDRPMMESFVIPLSQEKPLGNMIVSVPSVRLDLNKQDSSGHHVLSAILFISEEEYQDEEQAAKKIKMGRKVLERIFPELKQVIAERVLVVKRTVMANGSDKKLDKMEKLWKESLPPGTIISGESSYLGVGLNTERAISSACAASEMVATM